MPAFPIIDTHVHFWDRDEVPLSWPKGLPIDRPFGPADYSADLGPVDVDAIVFVEADVDAGHHLAEADAIARLAQTDPRIEAIVAHAPMDSPRVATDLAALSERPLVRAIRHLIQGKDAAALTTSDAFREGLRRLPDHGFHFEICILHDQLAPVIDLVAACPEVRFVLDHIAKPGIKAGLRDPWWAQIETLAGHDNVVCKMSGVATEADHEAWREEELLPYMRRALEAFGPGRMMFGSDWPVMRLATAYPRWVEIVDAALSDCSDDERRAVFVENAKAVYRL